MTDALPWLLLLLALLCVGCGSPFRNHSTAIVAVASAHAVAFAAVDEARDQALDRVEAQHPDVGPERAAALRAEDARWRPAGAALDGVRHALGVWVEAVDAARRSDAGEDDLLATLTPVVARVVQLYGDVVALLRGLGVEAPELPSIVTGLATAAVGE